MVAASVTVDGGAFKKYDRLTEEVRAALRVEIVSLTKDLATRVRAKLVPGALFKTTTRILPAVGVKMVENVSEIYGSVYIDERKFPSVVALTLESGSRPHDIVARNGRALYFYWAKLGRNVAFQRVHHPGFAGRSYMVSSLEEMKGEAVVRTKEAVLQPVQAP